MSLHPRFMIHFRFKPDERPLNPRSHSMHRISAPPTRYLKESSKCNDGGALLETQPHKPFGLWLRSSGVSRHSLSSFIPEISMRTRSHFFSLISGLCDSVMCILIYAQSSADFEFVFIVRQLTPALQFFDVLNASLYNASIFTVKQVWKSVDLSLCSPRI